MIKLKKLIYLFTIFISFHLMKSSDEFETNLALRFYHIKRLESPFNMILKLLKNQKNKLIINQNFIDNLSNKLVKDAVYEIFEKADSTKLSLIWRDIFSYKYLESLDLTKDFAYSLLMINFLYDDYKINKKLFLINDECSFPFILNCLNELEKFKQIIIYNFKKKESEDKILKEDILLRWYFIKRIEIKFEIFHKKYSQFKKFTFLSKIECDVSDPQVLNCIENMKKDSDLKSFYKIFSDIFSYKDISNQSKLKDSLKLFLYLKKTFEIHFDNLVTKIESQDEIFIFFGQSLDSLLEDFILYERTPELKKNIFEAIIKRFYIVSRLGHAVDVIYKILDSDQNLLKNYLIEFEDEFHHPIIIESLKMLMLGSKSDFLFYLWRSIENYYFIIDEAFINEFVKELMIISHVFCGNVLPKNNLKSVNLKELCNSTEDLCQEKLLDYLDLLIQRIEDSLLLKTDSSKSNFKNIGVFKSNVSRENILKRFYLIQRLSPIFNKIKFNKNYFKCDDVFLFSTQNKQKLFSHIKILNLIDKISIENSLDPLFVLWKNLLEYKDIEDRQFEREFLIFIFLLCHKNIKQILKNNELDIDFSDMSLNDILNLLDILIEEVPDFINQYELNSSMTWNQWLTKYWLAAPVGLVIFILKLWFEYKKKQKNKNSYSFYGKRLLNFWRN